MDQYINYNLFVDDELVGEGSAWLRNGFVRAAGGPLGLVGPSESRLFEDLFSLPVVKVEDTGEEDTFGPNQAMKVNVYMLSEKRYRLYLAAANGGHIPLTLPF